MPRVGYSTGKIDYPGPEAPGERIERVCAICGRAFWPRQIDVAKGGGRHCSKNCSARAFARLKCTQCSKAFCLNDADVKRAGRRFYSQSCAMSWRPSPKRRCEWCQCILTADHQKRFCSREHACEARRELIRKRLEAENLESALSVAAFARQTGRSYDSVKWAVRAGKLGAAWDGSRIDTEHPDAMAFAAAPLPPQAGRVQTAGQHPVQLGGEIFTLQELQHATGISCGALYQRIVRNKMRPVDALSMPLGRRWSKYNYEGKTLPEWATLLGTSDQALRNRVARGKPFSQVVEEAKERLTKSETPASC